MPGSSSQNKVSAFDKAVELLARRDHSELEIRQKLQQREYSESEIDACCKKLEERRYLLPPSELSEKLLRLQLQRGKGARFIEAYLRKKGLPVVSIEEEVEVAAALDLLQRRAKSLKDPSFKEKQKLFNFLANRGFRFGILNQVLQRASEEAEP